MSALLLVLRMRMERREADSPSSIGRGILFYVLRWWRGHHRERLTLAFAALKVPPLPPDRTGLWLGKRAVAGPEKSSASEALELAEADLI